MLRHFQELVGGEIDTLGDAREIIDKKRDRGCICYLLNEIRYKTSKTGSIPSGNNQAGHHRSSKS